MQVYKLFFPPVHLGTVLKKARQNCAELSIYPYKRYVIISFPVFQDAEAELCGKV